MRKFVLFLVFATSLAQAQDSFRENEAEVAPVDAVAPIGLDLMAGNKEGITVYPNADNDHILISVAGKKNERKSISIFDFSGRIVFQTPKSVENTYLVDVSGLKKDFYILEVYSGGKVYRKKWLNR